MLHGNDREHSPAGRLKTQRPHRGSGVAPRRGEGSQPHPVRQQLAWSYGAQPERARADRLRSVDYEYSFAIDWILAPELAEKLVRGSYILEAAGPAASGSANAPVLDVEGKKSRLR